MDHNKSNTPTPLAKIQTYAIVTVVAALIWLYSESENVKQQKSLRFTVQFVAPPGQQLMILLMDTQSAGALTTQQIDLTVRCATSQYAQLQQLQISPIELAVKEDPDDPTQIVDLRDLLQDSPIGNLGVTFQTIEPRRVRLRVERMEQITIPIQIVVADSVHLANTPTADPAESIVSLPASIAQRQTELKLVARLDPEAINRLDPNVPRPLVVGVALSPAETLPDELRTMLRHKTTTITPSSTTVTVTIRKQTGNLTLTSLPILLTGPWEELKRFSIEIEGGQRVLGDEVRISGPSDVIDSIESGELSVWADLRLTADDLESGITAKQLHISVPTGVHVESTIPRLNFTITPINGTAPSITP